MLERTYVITNELLEPITFVLAHHTYKNSPALEAYYIFEYGPPA
jgi:hypothetical protein